MNEHLISVLIPARNVENYIEESLKSLQSQTHKNFEAIVVVNGSTDSTKFMSERFSQNDSRFKVYDIGFGDGGIVRALNYGLKMCGGDYVARFDADDRMYADRLYMQLKALKERNLDLVGIDIVREIDGVLMRPKIRPPLGIEKIRRMFPYRNPFNHSWLCKKSLYDSLGGYRFIPFAEDYDFIGRAILKNFSIDNINYVGQIQVERTGNTASTNYCHQVNSQIMISQYFNNKDLETVPIFRQINNNLVNKIYYKTHAYKMATYCKLLQCLRYL